MCAYILKMFTYNSSGAIWWPNLQLIQAVPLKSMLNYSSWKIYSSYGLNTPVRCASGNVLQTSTTVLHPSLLFGGLTLPKSLTSKNVSDSGPEQPKIPYVHKVTEAGLPYVQKCVWCDPPNNPKSLTSKNAEEIIQGLQAFWCIDQPTNHLPAVFFLDALASLKPVVSLSQSVSQ